MPGLMAFGVDVLGFGSAALPDAGRATAGRAADSFGSALTALFVAAAGPDPVLKKPMISARLVAWPASSSARSRSSSNCSRWSS